MQIIAMILSVAVLVTTQIIITLRMYKKNQSDYLEKIEILRNEKLENEISQKFLLQLEKSNNILVDKVEYNINNLRTELKQELTKYETKLNDLDNKVFMLVKNGG